MSSCRGLVVLVIAFTGCLDSASQQCHDGRVCPSDNVCDEAHKRCVFPEQLTSCNGLAEGATCNINGKDVGVCRDSVCLIAGCGDGIVAGSEQCDTTVADNKNECIEHSFYAGGAVTCTDNCTFDTSLCSGYCGDGVVNGSEKCDPGDTTIGGKTCKAFGYYLDGNLACSSACTFDTSGCSDYCGDGIKNGQEDCDGGDLGGANCTTAGFYNASGLACAAGCRFDTTACTGYCGDGTLDAGEDCDDNGTALMTDDVLGGRTCQDFGFYNTTTLGCSKACTFDVSQCTGSCGDRTVDSAEVCDGQTPTDASCTTYGFDFGSLSCSGLCAPDFTECRAPSHQAWSVLPDLGMENARSIWGSGANDIFVVGGAGSPLLPAVQHWDGTAWSAVQTLGSFSGSFKHVWGHASNDVFAVGDQGVIYHYDGASWSSQASGITETLEDVWGTASNNVYAVGDQSSILHYDGSSWSPLSTSPVAFTTGVTLIGVWGSAANDVYVLSQGAELAHWDGVNWTLQPLPTVPPGTIFNAIYGTSGKDIFVPTTNGVVVHYDGTTWSVMQTPTGQSLHAMWASGPGDVYAVGSVDTIVHYDGVSWSTMQTSSTSLPFFGVWGSDAGNVYATGYSGIGTPVGRLRHFSGEGWAVRSSRWGGQLRSVWSDGAGHAVVAGDSAVLEFPAIDQPGAGPFSVLPNKLFGVGGNATELFAVGANYTPSPVAAVFRKGGSGWQPDTAPTGTGLWAVSSGATGSAYAVGENGLIAHYTGSSTWTAMTSPTSTLLLGVWAASATEAFAVGNGGTILHLSSGTWSMMTSPVGDTIPAVWGASAKDVFAVTDQGRILHYDGATWTTMASLSYPLHSIGGSGPGDVFASGDNGHVLHYDGLGWGETVTKIGGTFYGTSGGFVQSFSTSSLLEWRRGCAANETGACTDDRDNDCDGLFDCGDPDCAGALACAGGGFCGPASSLGTLSCNAAAQSGTTLDGVARLANYACDANAEHGREKVYKITPATTGNVTVTLASTEDLDLVVLASAAGSGCEPRNPGCRGAGSHAGGNETVMFAATGGQTYYVIVDGFGSAAGAFTIAATCP